MTTNNAEQAHSIESEQVSAEMRRIREAIVPDNGGDKEDLISYAKEVVSLRADVERYQWLRRRIAASQLSILGAECSNTLDGVDAGIDAAMAAKEGV